MEYQDKDLRIGDKVWKAGNGNGIVKATDDSEDFPILVKFKKDNLTFTQAGQHIFAQPPTLFHGHRNEDLNKDIKPRRIVTRYINIWVADNGVLCMSLTPYSTGEKAQISAERSVSVSYVATAVPIEIPEDTL